MGFRTTYRCELYLEEDERRIFAKSSHQYLIEQVKYFEYKNVKENSLIEFDLFHPIKEFIFVLNRNDNNLYNQWNNNSTLINPENFKNRFYLQDNWWFNSILSENEIEFTPKGSNQKIICDRFQEFIFRYGPFGEASNIFKNKEKAILGFTIDDNSNLHSLEDIVKFRQIWEFTKAEQIPQLDINNYKMWDNPLKNMALKFNNQYREDKKNAVFFKDIQPINSIRDLVMIIFIYILFL